MVEQGAPTQEEKDQLYQALQQLPASQKAELINRILRESGLTVTLDSNCDNSNLSMQIDTLSPESLSQVLRAIAQRIEKEE